MTASARHWPEFAMEAACLGLFMISACVFVTLLEHPMSPVHRAIPSATLRRVLVGIAMGLTAVGLIYSPWGQRSGAHMNPSLTLTYLRLRKIALRQMQGKGPKGTRVRRLAPPPPVGNHPILWKEVFTEGGRRLALSRATEFVAEVDLRCALGLT